MSDRMRRVDESLRHVLSEALLELKDPRIGFVTVTGVRRRPDLSQARVFVSVLGAREETRERRWPGSTPRTACCRPGSRAELRLKRTPHPDIRIRSERRARRAHDTAHR